MVLCQQFATSDVMAFYGIVVPAGPGAVQGGGVVLAPDLLWSEQPDLLDELVASLNAAGANGGARLIYFRREPVQQRRVEASADGQRWEPYYYVVDVVVSRGILAADVTLSTTTLRKAFDIVSVYADRNEILADFNPHNIGYEDAAVSNRTFVGLRPVFFDTKYVVHLNIERQRLRNCNTEVALRLLCRIATLSMTVQECDNLALSDPWHAATSQYRQFYSHAREQLAFNRMQLDRLRIHMIDRTTVHLLAWTDRGNGTQHEFLLQDFDEYMQPQVWRL